MAWTITQTIDDNGMLTWEGRFEVIVVKLACASDASASGDIALEAAIMEMVNNSFLWFVACDPGAGGAAPDAAFQLQLKDKNGLAVYDSGSGGIAEDADTFQPGAKAAGMPPPFFRTVTFVCGTLGNANTADFYLYFAKGM